MQLSRTADRLSRSSWTACCCRPGKPEFHGSILISIGCRSRDRPPSLPLTHSLLDALSARSMQLREFRR
jgi:hypothetical protein